MIISEDNTQILLNTFIVKKISLILFSIFDTLETNLIIV